MMETSSDYDSYFELLSDVEYNIFSIQGKENVGND